MDQRGPDDPSTGGTPPAVGSPTLTVGVETLTVGVEEEFLLIDPESLCAAPRAAAVLTRVREAAARPFRPDEGPAGPGPADPSTPSGAPGPYPGVFHGELHVTQVEAATGVCDALPAVCDQLTEGRLRLAAAARAEGLRLVSAGTPVLPGPPPAHPPGSRFSRIAQMYAGVVADYQACGCHVHVGIPDRDTAVAVVNHLRPWLPTLLALSANSPYDRGRDSGYASWRMMEQARFPGSGLPPWFGSAAAYDAQVDRLVEAGVLVDSRMSFWLARPSPHLPTVEIRVADAAATVDDAVLQAALTRALVATACSDLAAGREAPPITEPIGAAAVWSAARYGLDGPAVHPVRGGRMPASRLLEELIGHVEPALVRSGELGEVRALLAGLARQGTGAVRQRRAAARGARAVVGMLIDQTVRPGGGTPHPPHVAQSMGGGRVEGHRTGTR